MKYIVKSEWLELPYVTGTLDNISSEPVELAKADEEEGIFIYPYSHWSWKDATMKVRRIRDDNYMPPTVNVVGFLNSTGGADSAGRADAATNIATPEEIKQMFK